MVDLSYEQYTSIFSGTVSSKKFDLCYPVAWSVANDLLDDQLRTRDEGTICTTDLYAIRKTLSYLTYLCDKNTDESGQSIYSLVASETVGPHSVSYANTSAYGSDLKGMLRYYAKSYLAKVSFYNKPCAWV